MQPAEYQQLRAYEDWYWWYAAQRMNLVSALRELKLPREAKVLDAGCGSGAMLELLTRELKVCGHGVDVSEHAAGLWNGSRLSQRCRASVNALPYGERAFDAVYSVDVLGCAGVERSTAIGEMSRVLRLGGLLVLLAPAYQWMLSSHDASVHSVHRFTRKELAELARRAGFEVIRVTHRFPLFFPMIAAVRMVRKLTLDTETQHLAYGSSAPAGAVVAGTQTSTGSASLHPWLQTSAPIGGRQSCVKTLTPAPFRRRDRDLNGQLSRQCSGCSLRSDLRPIPRWLNGALLALARVEHVLVRGISVPFGTTILLVARKVGR